ncbi:hypothetical protein FACS189483_08290 [Spirochaetia bacterium]|nr:hypothetical protein FACS189483_08290 [Spirochaetia bacterium]
MKRNLLSLMLLLNVFYGIYSQEISKNGFEYSLNYGSFGGGINFSSNEYDFEVSISLINFFIEHDKTNIGLEISPLSYFANYSVTRQEWNQNLYFLNGSLYWNPFDIKNIILGPFVSINYLSIENWAGFNANAYRFNAGLRFLLRIFVEDWERPFKIIGSEVGYSNILGKHSFYFTVNFDITILAGLIVGTLQSEASEIIETNNSPIPQEPKQPTLPFQNGRNDFGH